MTFLFIIHIISLTLFQIVGENVLDINGRVRFVGTVRINCTIVNRTSLFWTCFLYINWWFRFAACGTCHIAIGWSLRYISNWYHYIIILLLLLLLLNCNICLYVFLVHSSSLRSFWWRCIICKIFAMYRLVIKWFVYDKIFACMVPPIDSIVTCIIFTCFMPSYLCLVRLLICLNLCSNLFVVVVIFGKYSISILMQILLWLCRNYCIWMGRSFPKRCFTLKYVLFVVVVTCWRGQRPQFQANIYARRCRGLIKLKAFFKFGSAYSGHWWEITPFTIVVGRRDSFCIDTFDKFEYIFSLPWLLRLTRYFYKFLVGESLPWFV
jgi:hypothetical protein